MRKLLVLALALACGCDSPSSKPRVTYADEESPILVGYDLSPPLRDLVPVPPAPHAERENERRPPVFRAATDDFIDPVAQTAAPATAAPAMTTSFEGLGQGFVGPAGMFTADSDPPDTNGDVGPNHYVQSVNVSFAVFSKTGTPMFGPAAIKTVWSGFGGKCETSDDGDPLVKYDAAADRWVLSQFAVSGSPNMECIAVSETGDPLGAWHRYAFSYTVAIDYPKMGIWPDAYYVTQNTDNGTTICAFERDAMLAGTMARSQCFTSSTWGMMPADSSGPTRPTAGTPNYVLALDNSALALFKLGIDWTTPASSALVGPTSLPVAAFSQPSSVKQPGSSTKLDAIGEELMYGLEWRKFDDHEALVVNHTVSSGGRVGIRWYEIRDPGGTPTVFDQGTYTPDTNQRWMGSINIDHMGDIAIGYSVAGGAKPSIHYTGRQPSDPPGMMQAEATMIDGTGLKADSDNPSRWGDYSTMSIDPSDDCTFWYTQEYLTSNGTAWHTRVGSFKYDTCNAGSGSGTDGSGSGTDGSGSSGGDDDGMDMQPHSGGCSTSAGGGWALLASVLVVFGMVWRSRRR